MYRLEIHRAKGGSDERTVPDMSGAKETARNYLDMYPLGSVEVFDSLGRTVTVFYCDMISKAFKDVRNEKFIIAHNDSYPHSSAKTLIEARVKACGMLRDNNWSGVGIFAVNGDKASRNRLVDVGYVITNGYRYEYSDVKKKKGYTLNPSTGRISKY